MNLVTEKELFISSGMKSAVRWAAGIVLLTGFLFGEKPAPIRAGAVK